MHFDNCATAAALFTRLLGYFNCNYLLLNWKFETFFFCWGWDFSYILSKSESCVVIQYKIVHIKKAESEKCIGRLVVTQLHLINLILVFLAYY